jgi:nucleotide-binding universal stress UspA family protein
MTTSPNRSPFASILCPVDFSTHSKRALEYAALVARRSGGALSVLFVNDPLLVSAAAAAYDERALASRSRTELSLFVKKTLRSRAPTRHRVATFVTAGNPAGEIVKTARRLESRLIVVGSEGLGGAPKLFFGSTTAQVLARSAVPVLAVPPAGSGPAKASWPGRRVLAAISLGRHAARDVAAAAELARWFGATLALAHIVEPTRLPGWLSRQPAGHDRSRVEAAKAKLGKLAADAGPARFAEGHVLVGEPAAQIATLASELGAGLVVVTLRKAPGLFGARQGSMTYRVVREARTPVLALPSAWRPVSSRHA